MDSNLLATIHVISVMLFLLTYVIKTILLFSSKTMLEKYSRITKVPEMIISTVFLITGIWLFIILGGIKVLHIVKLILVFVSIPVAMTGFRKQNKGMALLSLLLIIGAYGLAEASRNKPFIPARVEIAANGDAKFAEGAKLFYENCAFCHGTDGKKMYRGAKDLTVTPFAGDDIAQMIKEGSKGKMPGFASVLSDENVDAITLFVQGMKVSPSAMK